METGNNNHNNKNGNGSNRTAILVRCSVEEADLIRGAAHRERRTLSGFILNAVMNRIAAPRKIETLQTATSPRLEAVEQARK